ncbi:hypothetical protein NL676_004040 [Syzygium grande]|nr:hypothetical protein NL676_004040 [Syzygium grande]
MPNGIGILPDTTAATRAKESQGSRGGLGTAAKGSEQPVPCRDLTGSLLSNPDKHKSGRRYTTGVEWWQ